MTMTPLTLHTLNAYRGSRRQRRRVGRGNSSRGTYSGRGMKGQRSRTGGRTGLIRRSLRSLLERVPKQRGFRSLAEKFAIVNLRDLDRVFTTGTVVAPEQMKEQGLIKTTVRVKVLGGGQIAKALTVRAHKFSGSAKTAIEQAGGKAIELTAAKNRPSGPPPTTAKERRDA